MKKKGFTLIELLAVIVILAILALLVSPIISGVIKKSKISSAARSMEGFVKSINSASMLYSTDNEGVIASGYVDIETLVEAKNKSQIKNPKVTLNDNGIVTKVTAQIDNYYCMYKEGKETICSEEEIWKLKPGTKVYFDPVKGEECSDYTEFNSASGVKEGCMLFYVINDNGDTVDLILDHNSSSGIQWYTSMDNSKGPTTALAQLKEDTSNWSGVPTREDNYTVTEDSGSYTVDYNGSKARMITSKEVREIIGTTDNKKAYAWLFNNLSGGTSYSCIEYGCTMDQAKKEGDQGYWTSNAYGIGMSPYAYKVSYNGNLFGMGYYVNQTAYGVRPVITIDSDKLSEASDETGNQVIIKAPGTVVYFDPVKGKPCNNYVAANSLSKVNEGCLLFYVIKDNGGTVDLILDHNTSGYKEGNFYDRLMLDTAIWEGVPSRTDTYKVTGKYGTTTKDYTGYKARFITAQEIADITGATTKNHWNEATSDSWFYLDSLTTNRTVGEDKDKKVSDYAWLFNRLNSGSSCTGPHSCSVDEECTKYGCTAGFGGTSGFQAYVASTNICGDSTGYWSVDYTGRMYYGNNKVGIRPVITIARHTLDEDPVKAIAARELVEELTVYFNPVTGQKCNYGNQGCMSFYMLKDNGETVDLILSNNTSSEVEWEASSSNRNGPTSALEQLKKDTEDWVGVPTRTDSYTRTGTYGYTIDYSGYKARLITAQEIADITGATEKNNWNVYTAGSGFYFDGLTLTRTIGEDYSKRLSNYAWLFNGLSYCADFGCTISSGAFNNTGYWTADSYTGNNFSSWFVSSSGLLSRNGSKGYTSGIRPVITISSNILK